MPTDMRKYPTNWAEIRNRILRRAGGNEDDPRVGARCEWCNIRNYTLITSIFQGNQEFDSYQDAVNYPAQGRVVVLTIAHILDPDPQNVADDNLAALCQKCHNRHDVEYRKRNRATTRRARLVESGQAVLI